jgi:AMP-polyphosphate phosphotransferase
MFESAEIGHRLGKAEYDTVVPQLREDLLNAQFDLSRQGRCAVLVLLAGLGGGGRSEVANLFSEWMDPRHLRTRAFGHRNDLERERPPFWRYWNALPPKGRIGVLLGGWHQELIGAHAAGHADGDIDADALAFGLQQIRRFEAMLAAEGVVLLKLWLHLSKADQKKRLATLTADPRTRWRVTRADRAQLKGYNRFRSVAERALQETSIPVAPWLVIEATDPMYRDVTVGRALLHALEPCGRPERRASRSRRQSVAPEATAVAAPLISVTDNVALLRELDLSQSVSRETYRDELARLQERLAKLTRRRRFARQSAVAVFEGQDAAGKGSTIRRVVHALDTRQYTIVPVAAPSDDERAHPYLWRFWRQLPGAGHVTVFDRSWYGRVLVERVEGYCAPADWMRAYDEIVDFEDQLHRNGTVVMKFWLQISKAEQLRRFRAREDTPFKRFKITPDDWRNRRKWNQYESAVCDMIDRTSTTTAPWTIVESEDKLYGRLKVLRTLCESLERS